MDHSVKKRGFVALPIASPLTDPVRGRCLKKRIAAAFLICACGGFLYPEIIFSRQGYNETEVLRCDDDGRGVELLFARKKTSVQYASYSPSLDAIIFQEYEYPMNSTSIHLWNREERTESFVLRERGFLFHEGYAWGIVALKERPAFLYATQGFLNGKTGDCRILVDSERMIDSIGYIRASE